GLFAEFLRILESQGQTGLAGSVGAAPGVAIRRAKRRLWCPLPWATCATGKSALPVGKGGLSERRFVASAPPQEREHLLTSEPAGAFPSAASGMLSASVPTTRPPWRALPNCRCNKYPPIR